MRAKVIFFKSTAYQPIPTFSDLRNSLLDITKLVPVYVHSKLLCIVYMRIYKMHRLEQATTAKNRKACVRKTNFQTTTCKQIKLDQCFFQCAKNIVDDVGLYLLCHIKMTTSWLFCKSRLAPNQSKQSLKEMTNRAE